MAQHRRNFTPQFKAEAVQFVIETLEDPNAPWRRTSESAESSEEL